MVWLGKTGRWLHVCPITSIGYGGSGQFHVLPSDESPLEACVFVEKTRTGKWSDWEDLGGHLTSAPAAIAVAGNLRVFARGNGNQLIYKHWDGTWSDWQDLGGELTNAPMVVLNGPDGDIIEVFTQETQNRLILREIRSTEMGCYQVCLH